jgi:hypothetical protein
MGGLGSGRTRSVPTIESRGSLVLDVNTIMRAVHQALRSQGLYPPQGDMLSVSAEIRPSVRVDIRLELEATAGIAVLAYDIKPLSKNTGPQKYPVRLVATPCRFGSVRWWWVCPQTGRQVVKLHLPDGGTRFLSREAHRLTYASQREDKYQRAHRRGERIRCKLGGVELAARGSIPSKPPRMRQATYERFQRKLLAIEILLDQQLEEIGARLGARMNKSSAPRFGPCSLRWDRGR